MLEKLLYLSDIIWSKIKLYIDIGERENNNIALKENNLNKEFIINIIVI